MEDNLSELPEELQPFKSRIQDSVSPFIRITAEVSAETSTLQSKFGGKPYLPQDTAYPVDVQDKPMLLLAQIACADLPPLEPFPQKGMLQFYIADDDMYGLDLDEPDQQHNFKVLYFPEINQEQCRSDFSFLPEFKNSPLRKNFTLHFQEEKAPVGTEDIHFDSVFGDSPFTFFDALCEKGEEIKKTYQRIAAANGHKVGGYAQFTQEDPRWTQEDFAEAILLLQIDSDGDGIQWGDQGIAHFFIRPDDLKKLDFSKVLYNWDSP